jgi:hypothetical protein
MLPPFVKLLDSNTIRLKWYGFAWYRPEYDISVLAPLGLHLVYGLGHAVWITFLVGFGRFNRRMQKLRQKESMAAKTLTLEQVQRRVLQAATLCPEWVWSEVMYERDCPHEEHNYSGWGDLFPKAGEPCQCPCHVDLDPRGICLRNCCSGLAIVPTQDVGTLLEAFHDYLAKDYLGYETIWGFSRLWKDASGQNWALGWGHDPDKNKIDDFVWGETQLEVLWRALNVLVEARRD